MSSTWVAAYLVLFGGVAFLFVLVSLLIGRFLRARVPTPEKLETYECGEPTIGSSYIQFDLRFYVVALVFLVFDVEVAFFFPWATVFGKSTQLMDSRLPKTTTSGPLELSPEAAAKFRELGVARPGLPNPNATAEENARLIESHAGRLAFLSLCDIAVFFGVLLVGYAYVWYRGDLDWVRAMDRLGQPRAEDAPDSYIPPRPLGVEG